MQTFSFLSVKKKSKVTDHVSENTLFLPIEEHLKRRFYCLLINDEMIYETDHI